VILQVLDGERAIAIKGSHVPKAQQQQWMIDPFPVIHPRFFVLCRV
jgi:hypothetical protein